MKLESENNIIRGAIAGSLSAIVICLMMEFFEIIGLAEKCWLFMAGQAVMQFKHSLWQVVFAFLVHLGVGAFWGVIIALLFSWVFTPRHFLFKGAIIGVSIFFLHLGLLNNALHYPAQLRVMTLTLFLIFLSYILYGVLVSFILRKSPWRGAGDS